MAEYCLQRRQPPVILIIQDWLKNNFMRAKKAGLLARRDGQWEHSICFILRARGPDQY